MALPDSIVENSQHAFVAEDVLLELFRRRLPGIKFTSLLEQNEAPPYVLLRRSDYGNSILGNGRFTDAFYFSAEVFTSGVEADVEGPLIIEAMKNQLRIAALAHDVVLDGLGWVQEGRIIETARRRADFANSEGPVQYADLPQDYARYTATFRIQIKRAHVGPTQYDF